MIIPGRRDGTNLDFWASKLQAVYRLRFGYIIKQMSERQSLMDIEVLREQGRLHISLSGTFSFTAVRQAVDMVVDACKEEPCSGILFDSRPVTGEMPIPDRFEMGRYGAETLPVSIKVAVLARADQISPDGFFETVARNRDLDLRVFTDMHEATEWLRQEERDVV